MCSTPSRKFDVLVVGAGISGISAAYYLQKMCPNHSFAILEGRGNLGGTWDLFQYPGVRSDTDMHTLGFSFRPWTKGNTMASGPTILHYLKDTVNKFGIMEHIHFDHSVSAANWSDQENAWTVTASNKGRATTFTSRFLFMCSGYYSYNGGHRPTFPGEEKFQGTIVHPQEWPQDLDYRNKKVVVIGSGATAITLVPNLAKSAKYVTMLQRSPTYVVPWPSIDNIAKFLFAVFPASLAYLLVRKKNIFIAELHRKVACVFPQLYKLALLSCTMKEVGREEVRKNFTPSYLPWKQRVCLSPDGDLFKSIVSKKASVVTDHVSSFTEDAILLKSGTKVEADIVVAATGLHMVSPGGENMKFTINGNLVDFSSLLSYKGVAYSGVPNMAASYFSYVSKSWTLRAELTSQWVCRLLNHMESAGAQVCEPSLFSSAGQPVTTRCPFMTDFSPGYMQRAASKLPKQGNNAPWIRSQCYRTECNWLLLDPCDDGVMTFSPSVAAAAANSGDGDGNGNNDDDKDEEEEGRVMGPEENAVPFLSPKAT